MTPAPFRRIVVATDFSMLAERAWALAQEIAHATGAELLLAHVVPTSPLPIPRESRLAEAARKWAIDELEDSASRARAQGLRTRVALRVGVPYREIVTLARHLEADLIVVGTHGRGGIDRALLGSVADRLVRLAPCPVLTVPDRA
jgi:nucleotide-binding universal stress UspA family protein